ncbi:cytochrome c oxidase assembly protein COX15 [Hyaloraphidium curvatum]|nr:cytochrome c oxidase assembly protein COX15 [Hyaloraphidium curvatum]
MRVPFAVLLPAVRPLAALPRCAARAPLAELRASPAAAARRPGLRAFAAAAHLPPRTAPRGALFSGLPVLRAPYARPWAPRLPGKAAATSQLARLATAAHAGSGHGTPPPVVGYWLLANAALVFGIVVLGGITRLTESGLSITEWNLIRGMKWPSSEDEWNEEWRKYKETPEYKILNHSMSLNEFKSIFFYEWAHRMWGRFIGAFFILPAGYFLARGHLPGSTKWRVLEIGALIGFQGALGWYMVKSGLDEQHLESRPINTPRVSQYRLAAHLGTAFVVYAASVMEGLRILRDNKPPDVLKNIARAISNPQLSSFARASRFTAALTFITVLSGAFVAGLDAGLVYNEWPWMGGRIVPSDLLGLTEVAEKEGRDYPAWRNFLENPSAVQFDHRMLAYTTLTTVSALWLYSRRLPLPRNVRIAVNSLVAVAYLQATLGITTLLYLVPVELASAHQAGSLTLWTVALYLAHAMKRLPVK